MQEYLSKIARSNAAIIDNWRKLYMHLNSVMSETQLTFLITVTGKLLKRSA